MTAPSNSSWPSASASNSRRARRTARTVPLSAWTNLSMDRNSQRVAAAFPGCRSGTASHRAPAGDCPSSPAGGSSASAETIAGARIRKQTRGCAAPRRAMPRAGCTCRLFACDALAAVGAVPHLAEPVQTRASWCCESARVSWSRLPAVRTPPCPR